MADEPQRNAETGKPERKQSELPLSTKTALRPPATTGQAKKTDGSKKRNYAKYIMWPIVAICRGLKILWAWRRFPFQLFDRHNGSVQAVATLAIVCLTYVYVQYSKKQWQVAQDTLSISQRAYVTIGRKDGVVADFVVPQDPNQNVEIVIYFQNSGHLPAKFTWGTMAGFLGQGSKKNSGITYTHPYKERLSVRTRDKKTGSIGEQGESSIIAGESVFVATVGTISQKDLVELPSNNPSLLILGMYEYCDELGDHAMRQFGLRYRSNAPVSNLSFDLAVDNSFPILPLPKATATTEYLPPCETISERERQQPKH